jgi:hypothetical protein
MKSIALLTSVVTASIVAGLATPASGQTCPHPGTVNGISVLIYCGSAKATVKMGSQTFTLKNGQCKKAAGNFYLSFGDVVTQQVKNAPDSFLVIATASKDGMYSGTTVMATRSTHGWLADSAKLTLTHGTRAGTVTGTLGSTQTNAKVALHLTFTC